MTMEVAMKILLRSIPETGEKIGVGRTSVYALINEGRLKSVKIGARHLVVDESIEKLVDELAEETADA
jgi:predicted DNA-binding transcriptional regulator AlpA